MRFETAGSGALARLQTDARLQTADDLAPGEVMLRAGRLRFAVELRRLVVTLADRDEVAWPVPDAGYGGHALVVSPDERYLALFLYSGQSEQGWELFELEPALRRLGGLPYIGGDGDPPRFSPDGRWLAMFVARGPTVRGTDDDFGDVHDPDAADLVEVDWAAVYIQRVPEGVIERYAVGATLPRSFDLDDLAAWTTADRMRFASADSLVLTLPAGGELVVTLPIDHIPVSR